MGCIKATVGAKVAVGQVLERRPDGKLYPAKTGELAGRLMEAAKKGDTIVEFNRDGKWYLGRAIDAPAPGYYWADVLLFGYDKPRRMMVRYNDEGGDQWFRVYDTLDMVIDLQESKGIVTIAKPIAPPVDTAEDGIDTD